MKNKQNLRLIDAPIYRYWQALYLAFYSRRLYVDVVKRWRGYGLLYFLLVIAICAVPLSARIILQFNQFFNEQIVFPLKKLPLLYIQNGNVVFDKPMPYLIKNNKGETVTIIDTTGTVSGMNKLYPQLTVLITKDKIYFRPPKFQLFLNDPTQQIGESVYIQPISKDTNEVFVGKKWVAASGVLTLKWGAILLVYPFIIGFVYGMCLVFMLFLSFVGQLISIIIFKFKLKLKESCRLLLVAATPQVAIFFALHTVYGPLQGEQALYTILLAAYFSYAVISVKRESKKMVRG